MTRSTTILAMAITFALTAPALADEPNYAEYTAAARPHVKAAIDAFGKADYSTAVREFEAAYAIDRNPQLLYSWAQAERFAKRCGLAITRYREYLRNKLTDNQIAAARGGIAMCLESINKSSCENKSQQPPPEEPAPIVLPARLPWYKDPVGGAVVVGVAGIGIGVGFLIAASSSRERADLATHSDTFAGALDEATTRRRIGITALAVGAVLAGGGIGYYVYQRRGPRVHAAASTDGVAFAIAGSF